MIYLDDLNLQSVQRILKDQIPNTEVRIFGSRVKGNIKPYSDLDLCLMGDTPLPFETLSQIKEAFSGSDLPMRVDLVEWANITPEFQKIIQQNSEIISSP